MKNAQNIVAIIPARGGSKGIPRKNIYPLLGKPLIAYSIEAARAARRITRVIVSTDDSEIATVAKTFGGEVPFMRPKNLGRDTTPDLPVFEHALRWLRDHEEYRPDFVVHVWPTSPLRDPKDFDCAIRTLECDPKADSIRSVTAPTETPFKMWRGDSRRYLKPLLAAEYRDFYKKVHEPHAEPRQILPPIFVQSCYLAVIRPNVILRGHSMSGSRILPFWHDPALYTELDTLKDLYHTEYTLKAYHERRRWMT